MAALNLQFMYIYTWEPLFQSFYDFALFQQYIGRGRGC